MLGCTRLLQDVTLGLQGSDEGYILSPWVHLLLILQVLLELDSLALHLWGATLRRLASCPWRQWADLRRESCHGRMGKILTCIMYCHCLWISSVSCLVSPFMIAVWLLIFSSYLLVCVCLRPFLARWGSYHTDHLCWLLQFLDWQPRTRRYTVVALLVHPCHSAFKPLFELYVWTRLRLLGSIVRSIQSALLRSIILCLCNVTIRQLVDSIERILVTWSICWSWRLYL